MNVLMLHHNLLAKPKKEKVTHYCKTKEGEGTSLMEIPPFDTLQKLYKYLQGENSFTTKLNQMLLVLDTIGPTLQPSDGILGSFQVPGYLRLFM